jgi:hypothetical protein
MTLVRMTTYIFCGAGVYTISELWHMAGEFWVSRFPCPFNRMTTQCKGLSPNLTEAEVFDSASRTARLCSAFYHFAKEAHTTLWFVHNCHSSVQILIRIQGHLLNDV